MKVIGTRLTFIVNIFFAVLILGTFVSAATVIVPAGNTAGGTSRKPLAVWYGFERSAAIYLGPEMGLAGGETVTQACWYVEATTVNTADVPAVIYMKNISNGNFAAATTVATEETGATQVFAATIPAASFVAGSFNCVTLSTPFAFAGPNLEVIVETNTTGTGTGSQNDRTFRSSATTPTTLHQTWQADNAAPITTGSLTAVPQRPNIQLTYTIPVGSGTVQFSTGTYSGNEGATVQIPVNRVGGLTGAISVNYATGGGTATGGASCGPGIDYVNAGGTLNWADNDNAVKNFVVDLCSDAVADPGESFNLTLSGAIGTTITGTNPAVFNITDVPPPLSGIFNVGAGQTYTSLTNPGGIFEAMNLATALSGNVTINISSDLTGETGAIALNELNGGFSVLIKPSGGPHTITTSSATSLIKLNGVDNVTIDGSTSGSTDRSLTVNSTGAGTIIWIATNATSGANNITLKNLNLTGPGPAVGGQGVIASSGSALGSAAEFPQSNNKLQNNVIKAVQNALFAFGNPTSLDQNWNISGNTFGSAVTAEKLSFRGMLIANANNFTVTQNTMMGVNSFTTSTSTMSGIQTAGITSNGVITRNKISNLTQNNGGGYGANGIFLAQSSTTSNTLVANNFIWDVSGVGFGGVDQADNGYGIVVASGGGYNIFYNSVNMATDQNTTDSFTAAVNILAAVTAAGAVDLRDNILANNETVGTRYSVINSSTQGAAVFVDSNYNDYFAQNVGRQGTTDYATLVAWQGATGKDANSKAVDPLFVSPTDLHLTATSTVRNSATPIAAVTIDIDGQSRPNPTDGFAGKGGSDDIIKGVLASPDMGGDEFYLVTAADVSISGRVTTVDGRGITNVRVSVTGNSLIQPIVTTTGRSGAYTLPNLQAGETYVVTVGSRRFTFQMPSRVISLVDNVTDADFVADN